MLTILDTEIIKKFNFCSNYSGLDSLIIKIMVLFNEGLTLEIILFIRFNLSIMSSLWYFIILKQAAELVLRQANSSTVIQDTRAYLCHYKFHYFSIINTA